MMYLVFLSLIVLVLFLVPNESYSEITYEVRFVGFGIDEEKIDKIHSQINLNQDKTIVDKGRITIDSGIHTIKTFTITRQSEKTIKITGMTYDGFVISLTGRLVTQTELGSVYDIRGVISGNNLHEKVNLFLIVEQKIKPSINPISNQQPNLESPKDLVLVVNHNFRNYWNENYKISIKIFDKSINSMPKFDDFSGTVSSAQVNVTISHSEDDISYRLGGMTKNNGYWQGSQYFPENISKPGKYNIAVVATHGNSTVSKNLEMFLFDVAANRATIVNGTAS